MSAVKTKSTFENAFADVQYDEVVVGKETVANKVAVRVKDDQGNFQLSGILSKSYVLVPNRKIRDIVDDITSRTDERLGGFENPKTLFDGKRYVDYFVSRNPIASMNGSLEKAGLKLGLMAWNAYDGSRKSGFEVFALNGYCTNEYHSRNRFGFFAFKHSESEAGQIDMDDALNSIWQGVQNIIRVAPLIGSLKKAPLALPDLLSAKENTDLPASRWGDVLDVLGKEVTAHSAQPGGSGTAFDLYQALTNVATHKLSGLSAIDTGSSITDHFFSKYLGERERPIMSHTTAESVLNSADRRPNREVIQGVIEE
jgi:hypothetical protein